MAVLAFPLLRLRSEGGENLFNQSDPVLDTLADEIARIAADGAQSGFKAEHFRRSAAVMRTLDAWLEEKGAARELNRRLEDDDYGKLNPCLLAQETADYWQAHGVYLSKDDLTARLSMDPMAYREMKAVIKKQGGVHALHSAIAAALERRAKEYETAAFKGRVAFPAPRKIGATFTTVQFPGLLAFGSNFDCLCRAMVAEGVLLAVVCGAALCPPCCAPAVVIIVTENLFESMGLCNPNQC